ncbi:MAG: OsmC family protein [Candidatus Nealsonbacteria bacterium]|nr:OsmC family protein [Candidatus Nealsonbacteria bacterium]
MDLISVTRRSGLEFGVRVRGHDFTVDMSVQDGGGDAGLSPAELTGGALGACVAMMVQSYCDRHGYEGDVEVNLTLELADSPKRIGAIVVDVELPESVPEERKDAIRRMAEKCPIHETFRHPPRVDIEVE